MALRDVEQEAKAKSIMMAAFREMEMAGINPARSMAEFVQMLAAMAAASITNGADGARLRAHLHSGLDSQIDMMLASPVAARTAN